MAYFLVVKGGREGSVGEWEKGRKEDGGWLGWRERRGRERAKRRGSSILALGVRNMAQDTIISVE